MSTKLYFIIVILTCIIYSVSTQSQVGDRCTDRRSLKDGICRFSKDCPRAEELGRLGIAPTLCGHRGTQNIVCCEDDRNRPEANENSFLNQNTFNRPDTADSFYFPGQSSNSKPTEHLRKAERNFYLHKIRRKLGD